MGRNAKKILVGIGCLLLCAGIVKGCKNSSAENSDVDFEGYFNSHPISYTIDQDFPNLKESKIKEMMNALDLEATGIRFEYKAYGGEENENNINFHWDNEGEHTGIRSDLMIVDGMTYSSEDPENNAYGDSTTDRVCVVRDADGKITGYILNANIYFYPLAEFWGTEFDDLFYHELLHTFGFPHSTDENSIMYPYSRKEHEFTPAHYDEINEKFPER